ncbi:hypothetical protein PsorP6_016766 [Peronosclerospora sorghi]|uniref:Uncharacterized protein n=1 Tax=Peronosclerospora sorghi TaxID=230839 RepID=A0ACC0WCA9_9STRA|nr:hypothetical protein PsorP6_016766 [Peronosclerospora sorghi]
MGKKRLLWKRMIQERVLLYCLFKRIWEREQGNTYEDQMSSEQVGVVTQLSKVKVRIGILPTLLSTAQWPFLDMYVDGGDNSQVVIAQGFSKRHQGRSTFSKPLKPRDFLQRLQVRFKGTKEWPGSQLSVNPPPKENSDVSSLNSSLHLSFSDCRKRLSDADVN